MIWPTGLGDFLIKRVPAAETFGVKPPVLPLPPRAHGYLATGPARPLLWEDSSPIATTTLVLRFEHNRVPQLDSAQASELDESTARSMSTIPLETVALAEPDNTQGLSDHESGQTEIPPAEQLTPPETSRRSFLDQKFVNWVTRRMDDTEVEIPFLLPSGSSTEEPAAPTERVRVRYRTEP